MSEWRIPQPTFNADIRHVTVSTDDPEIGRAILRAYGHKLKANGMKSECKLIDELRAYPGHYTAAHDAADEIERLRAALRQICDGPREAHKSYAELFAEVCWEARAALGEKKDG